MINIFLGFCVCHNRLPMASTFVYTCFEEFCLLCGEMKKDGIISINSKEAVQLGLNDELLRVTGIKFDIKGIHLQWPVYRFPQKHFWNNESTYVKFIEKSRKEYTQLGKKLFRGIRERRNFARGSQISYRNNTVKTEIDDQKDVKPVIKLEETEEDNKDNLKRQIASCILPACPESNVPIKVEDIKTDNPPMKLHRESNQKIRYMK